MPPATQEYMTISPDTIVFAHGDSIASISIKHSCTCPFSWHSSFLAQTDTIIHGDTATHTLTVLDTVKNWLLFPADTTGDQANVPILTHPSEYQRNLDTAKVVIASNSYGIDTIYVIAHR
jgi:hypothetical protein